MTLKEKLEKARYLTVHLWNLKEQLSLKEGQGKAVMALEMLDDLVSRLEELEDGLD